MPATISPPWASTGAMLAESTRHSASSRWMPRSSVSANCPVESTALQAAASSEVISASSGVSRRSAALEENASVGDVDAGEQAGAVGYHVAGADADALAVHAVALDARAVADRRAGGDHAVAQRAARADRRAVEDDRALDRRARADAHARAEHDAVADPRAVLQRRVAGDQRRA